jgi:hypothetical protein
LAVLIVMIVKYQKEIEKLIVLLLKNELILDSNTPIIREGINDSRILTWAGAPKSGLFDNEFASTYEYMGILEKRNYNFVLSDGGIVQFCCVFNASTLLKQRFCYYPCPIEISKEDIDLIQEGHDFISLIQFLFEQELIKLNGYDGSSFVSEITCRLYNRSPFRFEYDPINQKANHSAAHLHMNKARYVTFRSPKCCCPNIESPKYFTFAHVLAGLLTERGM